MSRTVEPRRLVVLSLLGAAVVAIGSWVAWRQYIDGRLDAAEAQLQLASELVATAVSHWRVERLADARFVADEVAADLLAAAERDPAAGVARHPARAALERMGARHRWRACRLWRPNGERVLDLELEARQQPDLPTIDGQTVPLRLAQLAAGADAISWLGTDSGLAIQFDLPVHDSAGQVIGLLSIATPPPHALLDTALVLDSPVVDSLRLEHLVPGAGDAGGGNELDAPDDQLIATAAVAGAPWQVVARSSRDAVVRREQAAGRVFLAMALALALAAAGFATAGAIRRGLTEERQLTARLADRERVYRSLVEHASDVLLRVRFEPAPHFEYVSPSIRSLAGYSPEELYSDAGLADTIVIAGDGSLLQPPAADGPRTTELHQRWRHRDGRVVETEHRVTPLEEDGRVVGAESIVRDITDRLARDRRLRQLSEAVEQSPVSVILTDRTGRIEYVNAHFEATTGLGPDDVIGRRPRDLGVGVMAAAAWREVRRALIRREVWRGELVSRRRNGAPFWERWVVSALVDGREAIVGFVCVMADITEHKESEERLEQAAERLRQSQRLEALGRLAGGVAHDFNNVLSVILGYCELLQGRLAGSDAEMLGEVAGAAERASRLTTQLLAFGRQQVLAPRILDPAVTLAESRRFLERTLAGRPIELEIEVGPAVWPIEVDRAQLEQVLSNLITNARDAIEGQGQITIAVSNVAVGSPPSSRGSEGPTGDFVEIRVSDTGAGMSVATAERAFEPFFTTKEFGRGTGLGLATVYGIVRQSGGWIQIASTSPHGTVFEVLFPRAARRET